MDSRSKLPLILKVMRIEFLIISIFVIFFAGLGLYNNISEGIIQLKWLLSNLLAVTLSIVLIFSFFSLRNQNKWRYYSISIVLCIISIKRLINCIMDLNTANIIFFIFFFIQFLYVFRDSEVKYFYQ